jgi:hypothetical protein
VPTWHAIVSSEELACIVTKTPDNSDFVTNIVALIRLRAASDEGLSEDRCAPTITTGIGRFCSAKLSADAV